MGEVFRRIVHLGRVDGVFRDAVDHLKLRNPHPRQVWQTMANRTGSVTLRWSAAVLAAVVLFLAGWTLTQVESLAQVPGAGGGAHPYPRRVPAPSLDGQFEWINTTKPISLADLRGKFVLVDFWTFCCINCMHILPELTKLEAAYPTELVVVGVHSAKFAGERDTENIREAVARYEIAHPVVNDSQLTLWNRYGVNSWPTLVLIDPLGEAVWVGNGERKFEDVKAIIDRGLPFYRAAGLVNPAPLPFWEVEEQEATPLRFPGKVLADDAGGRLFITDSNHNRIVVTDLAGKVQQVIGSGTTGRGDGGFKECQMNHPQGLVLAGDKLLIADTENHLLRQADLTTSQVTTIAGTGVQGDGFPGRSAINGHFGGLPLEIALNSPWALWVHKDDLYIAMAGPHQIWKMSLDGKKVGPYAGNGREDIRNGRLLPKRAFMPGYASFAQPSGLASDGKLLFVADSEGSAIRTVPFNPDGRVRTLVGTIGSLFDFGDVDGAAKQARLQHPLGVVFYDGKLFIADTYNNKVKVLDVDKGTCETIAGSGKVGNDDAAEDGKDATFNEPGGITAADGKLYVADTNNHAIRVVEVAAPHRVSTLEIVGLAP
jgi:thiol-disulfide isomerase/thioredoxin